MVNSDTGQRQASYEHLFDRVNRETTGLRLGLAAAITIHLAVFAITWPNLAETEPESTPVPQKPVYFSLEPVSFQAARPIIEVPRLSGRVVPIPEPVRLNPEPIAERAYEISPPVSADAVTPALRAPPPAPVTAPQVVDVFIEVNPPAVIHRVRPRYTETARKLGIEGTVVLSLLIDTGGRVADLTVLRSLPFGLTQNAVEAVRQWRFEPRTFNDRPVRVRYTLTVVFSLDPAP